MLNLFSINSLKRILFAFLFSIVLLSCSEDDPVAPQEEHFDAVGTIIYDASGKEVVRIFRAVTSDTLFTTSGELTEHHTVKFLDDDGNVLDPPTDEHYTLSGETGNTNIAQFWQHPGEEGGFEFHIDAKVAGNTTLELFINHQGHADYRSGTIPVVVK